MIGSLLWLVRNKGNIEPEERIWIIWFITVLPGYNGDLVLLHCIQ